MSNNIDTFIKKYGIFANVEGKVYIRYRSWGFGQLRMAELNVHAKTIVRVRVRDKRSLGSLGYYERDRIFQERDTWMVITKDYQMDVGL